MEPRPTKITNSSNMDSARRSSRTRSRSRTPAEFNGENLIETKTISRTTRIKPSLSAATSTPISDASGNNTLEAISESYSKTVVNVVHNSKSATVNDNDLNFQMYNTGTNNKTVRRSGRPKVILSDVVTNGESTKIKEATSSTTKTSTSSSSVVTNKKKAALAKEKLIQAKKTSDYSSDDGDEKYRTVNLYRNAGDWWDAFPKTDYTYSPASEFRREVAPGVNQLPNMSRRSLASVRGLSSPPTSTLHYASSTTATTYWSTTANRKRLAEKMSEMSDGSDVDEVDYVTTTRTRQQVASRNYFATFFTSLLTVVTTVWTTVWTSTVGRITGERVAAGYSTPRRHGAAATASRSWWQRVTTWGYLMLAELDMLDTRILALFRSTAGPANDVEKRRRLKYFFLFLIFFLLLPLAGLWFWHHSADATFDPMIRIASESWAKIGSFVIVPFARQDEESYVTDSVPEPLTAHSAEYVNPTLSSHVTMAAGQVVDLNTLITQVVNSRQMQNLISSSQKPVDYEALVLRIINSKQIQTLIDVKALTAAIVASDELRELIASSHKEVDLEALTYYVLSSSQLRDYMESNQREPDVDVLATQIVNSGVFRQFIAANQKDLDLDAVVGSVLSSAVLRDYMASNQRETDVELLAAQIVNSGVFKQFKATSQKEFDLDTVVGSVLSSAELRDYMASNQREPDVDLLAAQIVNSDVFKQFKATSQKELDLDTVVGSVLSSAEFRSWLATNQKDVSVDAIVTQVLASDQLTSLLATSERQADSAVLLELRQSKLQEELEKKSALLKEHELALARLSAELAHTKDQMDGVAAKQGVRDVSDEQLRQQLAGLESQIKLLQDQQLGLKTCCDKPAAALPLVAIEQHVTRFLAGLFGQSPTGSVTSDELKAWIGNVFVAKDDLEARLANLMKANKQEVTEATAQSADKIMHTISDQISQQYVLLSRDATTVGSAVLGSGLSNDQVRAIVDDALVTYDADKTGMVDYALESSGGQVISTRCSEIYERSGTIVIFGIPLWSHKSNNPRLALHPGMQPGECWAFAGSRGYLVIELAGNIRISSFSVEHISRKLAFAGVIDSAPKDFTVLGLDSLNDPEPTVLGIYRYDQNGTSLQHFIVQHTQQRPYKLVELKIESNHGNLKYTCLYRFRVHGTWVSN